MIKVLFRNNIKIVDLEETTYDWIDTITYQYEGTIISVSHAFNTHDYTYSILITYKK